MTSAVAIGRVREVQAMIAAVRRDGRGEVHLADATEAVTHQVRAMVGNSDLEAEAFGVMTHVELFAKVARVDAAARG